MTGTQDKTYTLRQWVRMKSRERLQSRKLISVVVAEAIRQRELNPSLSVEECYQRASAGIVESETEDSHSAVIPTGNRPDVATSDPVSQ